MKTNVRPSELEVDAEPKITAVVADDSLLFLRVVCAKLRAQGRIRVVAAVSNGLDAVRETTLIHPNLVLLDVNMPEMNGAAAADIIHANYPDITVVLMGGAENDEVERKCEESGANAFILKRDLLDRISSDINKTGVQPPRRRTLRPGTSESRHHARNRTKSLTTVSGKARSSIGRTPRRSQS